MPRFFIDKSDIQDGFASVKGDDAFHIARALRMAVGDSITLCDSEGTEYSARLTKIRDDECLLSLCDSHPSANEPPVSITLFMAYPKSDKLEQITMRSVQLGCRHIIPFESKRCIKRPSADKADSKTSRLQRIALEAAKQCGRGALPTVHAPVSFREMLESLKNYSLVLFCYEGEGTRSLRGVLESASAEGSIAVIIGSEGGFAPEEAEAILSFGAVGVNLGPRILRCETAPDYVLSCLSYRFEL